jgi:hypothetical protein
VKRIFGFICVCISLLMASSAFSAGHEIRTMTFRKQIITDSHGFGCEALRMLVPKGWKFKGGVSWNYNKMPPEPSTAYTISSPNSRAVVEQFPHMNFFWSEDQNMQYSYSQAGFEIRPPMRAVDFLKNIFASRFRQGVSGLKVVDSGNLPQLAAQNRNIAQHHMSIFHQISPFQFRFQIDSDAGRIKMSYKENGRDIVEDVTATMTYMISYLQNMYGMTITSTAWVPVTYSFKAPAKEFDEKIRIFKIITDSRKENPVWAINCTKLGASVTREQLRQQNAIFNRMQQIRQTQSEISDMIMDSYQKRSASYDRVFDNYSQAVRGVDTYTDPVNNWNVDLPTGCDTAWTDGSDYLFSMDPGFNPNIGSTVNWERMRRQR